MLEGFTDAIMNNLDLIIVVLIMLYMVKMFKQAFGDKDIKKKRDIKSMADRIHNMMTTNASSVGLKKLSKVYLRGDDEISMHKVGTTVGGVLNFQEYIIIPIKTKWWNPLETARLLMAESEAVTDLHEGDLVIEGASIHPVTERFTWVVPNREMVEKYGPEEIEEKREAFLVKVFNALGNFDLNNDMWANTKTGMRGTRASARKEEVATLAPDKREEWRVEQEAQRDQRRIQQREDRGTFNRSDL